MYFVKQHKIFVGCLEHLHLVVCTVGGLKSCFHSFHLFRLFFHVEMG